MKIASFFKVLFLSLLISGSLQAQDVIYSEDFNDDIGKGIDGGSLNDIGGVDWTLNVDACVFTDVGDYVKVVDTGSDRFEVLDNNGEAIWYSPNIDILDHTDISISLLAAETGSGSNLNNKYIKLYYILDGGVEVSFFESSVNWGSSIATITNLNGSSMQLVARMKTTYASDKIYIDDIAVTGTPKVVSNDALTQVLEPTSQVLVQDISSIINDQNSAQALVRFKLLEPLGPDNLGTKISSIKFENIALSNQADLFNQFDDFAIHDGSNIIPTSSVDISADEVILNFAEDDFTLDDDSSQEYELRAYLKQSGIIDGKRVKLELAAGASGITNYGSGSGFDTTNSTAVTSPEHQVSVLGTNLHFTEIPANSLIKNTNFSVSLEVRDINGNIDLDANQTVDLSLEIGNGILTGVLASNLSSGQVTFNDLSYNLAESVNIKATASNYVSAVSDPISIISSQSTDVILPDWTPTSLNISSLSNSENEAVEVFRFSVDDKGDDSESTFLNTLRLLPGSNNNVNWIDKVAGFLIKVGGVNLDAGYVFDNSNLDINISNVETLREIPERSSKDFSIHVYLKTELVDGEVLQMKIDNSHLAWSTSGSGLVSSFSGDLVGHEFLVDVQGTDLHFTSIPIDDIEFASSFEAAVKLSDIHGNIDLDANQEVNLSLVDGNGELSGTLVKNLISGGLSFSDLSYNYPESIKLIVSGDGLQIEESGLIHVLASKSTNAYVQDWLPDDLSISSLSTSENDFHEIFRFHLIDLGDDQVATVLKTIKLIAGDENTLNWEDDIAGFQVKINNEIVDVDFQPSESSLLIQFAELELLNHITNGQLIYVSLSVYLSEKSTDGTVFQAALESTHSQWEVSGTNLRDEFTGNMKGNSFIVDVEGTELSFKDKPLKKIVPNTDFGMSLKMTDVYGNADLNSAKEAHVSLASGTGNLNSNTGLISQMIDGEYAWTDMNYDKAENFTLLIEVDGLQAILSNNISSLDVNSTVLASSIPIASKNLNPLAITPENSEVVLNFSVKDEGIIDSAPTIISTMKFFNAIGSSGFDWKKHLAGAVLLKDGEILAKTTKIEKEYLSFTSIDIEVENGKQTDLELAIYFKKSLLPDHSRFQVEIRKDHLWKSSTTGSGLLVVLPENIQSSIHQIEVEADRFTFINCPIGVEEEQNFEISIAAVDPFQNIDIDKSSSVSLTCENGTLSKIGVVGNLENGVLEVDQLSFTGDQLVKMIASGDLMSASKEIFKQKGNLVFSDDFESQELSLWDNIQDWTTSPYLPIEGSNSLKHNLSNAIGASSVVCPLNGVKLGSESIFWEFILKNSDWDPTSSNNFVFHLLMNFNDPELADNLYSVGVNLSRSDDKLSLWKTYDENSNLLIASDFDWSEDETVAVKVEYNSNGEWKLYYNRLGSKNNWLKAGEAISEVENEIENWFFGLQFNFETASRAGELWFDDIKVESYNTAPYLKTFEVFSDSLLLHFSERLNLVSSIKTENYKLRLNEALVEISNVKSKGDQQLVLVLEDKLLTGHYSLRITDIEDVNGARLNLETLEFDYQEEAQLHDLVINEILADESPAVCLPEYEFIEIYNASGHSINVRDFQLTVGKSEKVLEGFQLPSNEYLILCSNAAVDFYKEFGNSLGVSSFPSLTNSGTNISFESPAGILMDEISYSSDWYGDDSKKDGGWSLERIDVENYCSTISNWKVSNNENGGTPGGENSIKGVYQDTQAPGSMSYFLQTNQTLQITFSEDLDERSVLMLSNYTIEGNNVSSIVQESKTNYTLHFSDEFQDRISQKLVMNNLSDECGNSSEINLDFIWYDVHEHDLIINEILADESPAVGLPEYEFVEIYNVSDHSINVQDFKLTVGKSEKVLEGFELPSKEYLILCSNAAVDFYKEYGNALDVSSFPSLTNSGTNISLESPAGILMDEISYSSDWYGDDSKKDGGWSLERIDVENHCSTTTNWKASNNENGGSPGFVNSIKGVYQDTQAPELASYLLQTNQTLQITFSEDLHESSALILSNYTIAGNNVSSVIQKSKTSYILHFADEFQDLISQKLVMNNLSDECGNSNEISLDFIWYDVHEYDLVINEIMVDESPAVGLPEYEFVEIYNASDHPINVQDFKLTVGKSEKVLEGYELPSKEYLILCSNAAVDFYKEFGNSLGVSSFPSLTNSGTNISLESPAGILMDEITYSSDWYADEDKKDGGWSLERVDVTNYFWQADNWRASLNTKGGTPGQRNSIEALNPDLNKPMLLSFELNGTNSIILFFSESLDFNQALNIQNYSLNGDVDHPVSVIEIDDEIFALRLDFSSDFENNIQYQLVLSDNLVDLAGNSLGEYKVEFTLAEMPHTGDLIINEVLFNPYPNGADYVELINISDRIIDVKDLLIANRDENYQLDEIYPLSERSRIMEADAYLLLSTDTANVKINYSHVNESVFMQLAKMPSFNDDEGRVVILNRNKDQLDDFAYKEAMHFSQLISKEGVSLERINPNKETNLNSNWISASQTVDFGTPGVQNSSYDIDEVDVNEIGFKSKIFSPDNDGVDDRLIINFDLEKSGYVANIRIYNSFGREIRRLASNMTLSTKGELFWDGLLANKERAPIGIYAFYFELFHSDGEVKTYKKTCVLGGKFK